MVNVYKVRFQDSAELFFVANDTTELIEKLAIEFKNHTILDIIFVGELYE